MAGVCFPPSCAYRGSTPHRQVSSQKRMEGICGGAAFVVAIRVFHLAARAVTTPSTPSTTSMGLIFLWREVRQQTQFTAHTGHCGVRVSTGRAVGVSSRWGYRPNLPPLCSTRTGASRQPQSPFNRPLFSSKNKVPIYRGDRVIEGQKSCQEISTAVYRDKYCAYIIGSNSNAPIIHVDARFETSTQQLFQVLGRVFEYLRQYFKKVGIEFNYCTGMYYSFSLFAFTDRASTIPSNSIRGCQSGTWSAGQKKIRGTSTKPRNESKRKT